MQVMDSLLILTDFASVRPLNMNSELRGWTAFYISPVCISREIKKTVMSVAARSL